MNVRKVALFVEGATEQIFVRDFLAKWYDWDGQKVGFNCYALHSDNEYDAPHPYGSTDSENYFQIFNVGNDNSVLSKMLDRSERLSNVGYTLIIGLRDMFDAITGHPFQRLDIGIFDQKPALDLKGRGVDIKRLHFVFLSVGSRPARGD